MGDKGLVSALWRSSFGYENDRLFKYSYNSIIGDDMDCDVYPQDWTEAGGGWKNCPVGKLEKRRMGVIGVCVCVCVCVCACVCVRVCVCVCLRSIYLGTDYQR